MRHEFRSAANIAAILRVLDLPVNSDDDRLLHLVRRDNADLLRTVAALAGLRAARVPGLTVARTPDGRLSLRIRGVTSFDHTEPLLVVDGIAIQPGMNDHLAGLNAEDIASVEVLKDASATAMYGARGANGVIVIKTKQPEH